VRFSIEDVECPADGFCVRTFTDSSGGSVGGSTLECMMSEASLAIAKL